MHQLWIVSLTVALLFTQQASGLGCMSTVCSNARTFVNEIRECTSNGFCGDYQNLRRGNQYIEAVDLSCNEGIPVFAPFDGELTYYQPFGANAEMECADHGARIEGTGQWRGYYALISTVKLFKYGGKVRSGEKIGVVGNLECHLSGQESNYLRFQLFRNGQPIDPTSHLIDCMCTGQICQTNGNNAFIGLPFKHDSRYNGVRGWELKCPISTSSSSSSEDGSNAPHIYSPIDGNVIGRIRLEFAGTYAGCENEGLFITGTGKWADYDVRIYNVRFREDLGLGSKRIEQGQHIGQRLLCSGSPDSIFMEVRFQGSLVDISEAISATKCRHGKLGRIF